MALVLDDPQRVADWVGVELGAPAPSVDSAIGYEIDGELRAGVYFDAMTESNIFAHIASRAHAPRSMIVAVIQYVFGQLGLPRLSFAIPANNLKARQFVVDMGAYMETRLRQAAGAHDLLIYVMWARDPFPQRMLKRGAQ